MLAHARRLDPSAKNKLSVALAFAITLIIAVLWFGYRYAYSDVAQAEAPLDPNIASEIKNTFKDSSSRFKNEWQNVKKYTESLKVAQ